MSQQRRSILFVAVLAAGLVAMPVLSPSKPPATSAAASINRGVENHPLANAQLAAMSEAPASDMALTPQNPSAAATVSTVSNTSLAESTPSVRREGFGFVNAGNLGNSSVGSQSWNYSLLTTIAYFGLHVNSGDGHFVTTDTGWAVYHSTTMAAFVAKAHANGVRVIVSLNLHDFSSSPTNQTCLGLAPSSATATISGTVQQVAAAGIDGVNIDYEGTATTCSNGQTNRDEMTAFAKSLR